MIKEIGEITNTCPCIHVCYESVCIGVWDRDYMAVVCVCDKNVWGCLGICWNWGYLGGISEKSVGGEYMKCMQTHIYYACVCIGVGIGIV